MAVGFDFGTTNSLISVILRGRAIDVMDDDGLPFPSVVRYEGERVVVGRAAKESLDEAGLGVYGNTVRSPKFLLGDESVQVGGVERSPVDIVSDVVRHVKSQSLKGRQAKVLAGVSQAVVTIPVNMTGPRRAALRDAFRRADIGIVQFVHEPFAALYGYVRGQADTKESLRALNRRNVLVVDWGGGTLDLTLCRIEGGRAVQLRNGGSDEVGGDRFDEAIRNEVIRRFSASAGIPDDAYIHPDAKLRLLQDAETNKIALSERSAVSFYRPDFFSQPAATLEYRLTREELDEVTRPLIMSGMREIDSLLESVGIGPSQIAMCLVAGGMAAMPAIRGRLHELFGPQRVDIPSNSSTLIAQGAAWIAHDASRLQLAKPIELQLSRGAYLPLVKAGTDMPAEHEEKRQKVHLFCTDPTDGVAKFEVCAPSFPTASPQISDPRTPLGMLTVDVDARAKPLTERLELEVILDDDLILRARAWSAMAKDDDATVIHDLEFGLRLPGINDGACSDAEPSLDEPPHRSGGLSVRANIADTADDALVPGDVLYKHRPSAFERSQIRNKATEDQIWEHLYYQPCAVCRRSANDPGCRCATDPQPRAR
ncbi:Hsp70 family protein [Mycolicibacterium fortuitum]|uniref:Hsp70 family protein n=2 Tax=Mycolicibacterium fortuitum TaxID=1766 RepID=A0AAE4VKB8_MYCFO|nr:Hsp70 family protein [Mycolicibacterium fortuitum]MCA4756846.1 Hsp70 family protein [Mycolicibacterium fortuitum]MDV7194959.1 Hsp70 family protein [Mycolicibacterium fortuitum]MDV7208559.1 Hsp70 family protein [Mycolicibacterium fortuitum]MDV7230486.1 Hsp70 family protein [Mycolicibacterium fortuitum]MDV7262100.1 Hsp70 family protein [Mycolicibacterium fortuitum]